MNPVIVAVLILVALIAGAAVYRKVISGQYHNFLLRMTV